MYKSLNFIKQPNNLKIIFFLLVILICFYRSPFIFINGRFVAEEGSFFFKNSFLYGPLEGLFQLYTRSSYFNLWANISSVAAASVPIEFAPLITVYFAFAAKLILFYYILFVPSDFFQNNYQRYLVNLLVIFSPPFVVAELWLNTLVSQVYLSLTVFFIFFSSTNNKFLNKFSLIIIFIACLSSIIACLFTLGFVYKYFIKKNKNNLYQLLSIVSSSALQFSVFVYSTINYNVYHPEEERYLISLNKVESLVYNGIIKTFIGRDLTRFSYFNYKNDNYYLLILWIIFILIFIYFFIKNFNKLKKDKIFIIIFGFFILQIFIAFIGSKINEVSGRYISLPGILLLLSIFRIFAVSEGYSKKFFLFVLILSVTTGSYSFKSYNKYPQFFSCYNCPVWKNEINNWKKDQSYKIKIWQYPKKTMILKK